MQCILFRILFLSFSLSLPLSAEHTNKMPEHLVLIQTVFNAMSETTSPKGVRLIKMPICHAKTILQTHWITLIKPNSIQFAIL